MVMLEIRPRTRRPPRNYLARREQWRLLALVFSLGLVIILMARLRQPEAAALLGQFFGSGHAEGEAESAEQDVAAKEIAALVEAAQPGRLPPGTFRSAMPEALSPRGDTADRTASGDTADHFPGIRADLLSLIRDNTYFRSAETPAWFGFLLALQSADDAAVAAATRGRITRAQLVRQPQEYRGNVVTISGSARQVAALTPTEDILGQSEYYRLVIKPTGGVINPIVAYCLELPDEFPREGVIAEEVRLDGLFFKNWSYMANEELNLAPVVLARGLTWERPPPEAANAGTEPLGMFLGCVVIAAVLAGILAIFAWRRPVPRSATILLLTVGWVVIVSPTTVRGSNASNAPNVSSDNGGPRAVLELAGLDAASLDALHDGEPLRSDEQELVLKLLYRIRRFDPVSVLRWSESEFDFDNLTTSPAKGRAELFDLHGRARRLKTDPPPDDLADRYELPAIYHVEVETAPDGKLATIITPTVPTAWTKQAEFDEPFSATGLFLKTTGTEEDHPRLIFLASRVRWHPDGNGTIKTNFGTALLGGLGVDIGRIDDVRQGTAIRMAERDLFYQILNAAGQLTPSQLVRAAERRLKNYAEAWQARAGKPIPGGNISFEQRVAADVASQAEEGRFSVAPLFTDPRNQRGELFVIDGVARRVVEIVVGRDKSGRPSDVADRFGITHYYEVEVFTNDSQDLPLTFCVRELPADFPTGEVLFEEVRIAGFFFKKWRYQSRKRNGTGPDGSTPGQTAPLLIAPGLLRIESESAGSSSTVGMVSGGLFVLTLVAIWWLLRSYAKGDRAFYRRTIAPNYEPGQSLNDVGIEVTAGPDFTNVDSRAEKEGIVE